MEAAAKRRARLEHLPCVKRRLGDPATDAYDTANWSALFGAEVAASAALTGLIFVAVSINLQRILAFSSLPRRVLKALSMLCLVLFVSTLAMVPGQPAWVLGLELLAFGLLALIWLVVRDIGTVRVTESEFRGALVRLLPLGVLAAGFTAVAGASLWLQAGGGLYWLVPAMVCAFVAALVDAWVLLIEIVR
jgi:modulator of FtsH protease